MSARNERSLSNQLSPAKNHLIPITILVIVACFAVGIILGFGSGNLDKLQSWVLIIFLMIFSLGGLSVSVWLILRHSSKLSVGQKDSLMSWQVMLPETQRRKLSAEVKELAAIMNIPPQQISDLKSAYIVAEDLALRQIEQEAKVPMVRHVNIEGAEFDAVVVNSEIVTCVETVFLVTPHVSQEKINTILKKIEFTGKKIADIRPGSKLRLLLALITQLDQQGEAKLRSALITKFSATPVDVDIRLMDFENLQRVFASD
jgi:phosphopantetheine adenylyltransferase/F0F1-type ATP synthase assembly protein I